MISNTIDLPLCKRKMEIAHNVNKYKGSRKRLNFYQLPLMNTAVLFKHMFWIVFSNYNLKIMFFILFFIAHVIRKSYNVILIYIYNIWKTRNKLTIYQ